MREKMSDIIENEEIDKDTVTKDELESVFQRKYNLLTETAVSLNKSYINKLDVSTSLNVAVSLVDNTIEVYRLNKASLSRICRLSGHNLNVTEVVFCPESDNLLYSTSLDGLIKLWDLRASGSCVQEYKDVGEVPKAYECMDVSQNGRVLCAGSNLVEEEAYIVFWDQRNPAPLGGYWNSHTDDITQVKFHKERTEILTTGSLDGLINVFNITEQSEDDALTYSLNVENSVEKISWLDEKHVSCVTQSNDLQIWNTESGDMVKSYTRDKIAKAIKRSRGDECYVVDAFTCDDGPAVLAGSHAGDGDVLRAAVATGAAGAAGAGRLLPAAAFPANKQVVRCCWYHKGRDMLVATGESGLVSVWAGGAGVAEEAGGAAAHLVRPSHEPHVKRHKPY